MLDFELALIIGRPICFEARVPVLLHQGSAVQKSVWAIKTGPTITTTNRNSRVQMSRILAEREACMERNSGCAIAMRPLAQ
jgi:hypothetical protein